MPTARDARDVPVTDPRVELGLGGIFGPGGYGVVGGRPYGTRLRDEARTHARQWKFSPAVAGRMRAATRQALGR